MILARVTRRLQRLPVAVPATVAMVWFLAIHSMSFFDQPAKVVAGDGFVHDAFVNWAHFPMYAGLCLWISLALRVVDRVEEGAFRERIAFLATILAGVTDEWHQSLVPFRSADPIDFLTDVLAALGTLWMLRAVARKAPERQLWMRLAITAGATFLSAAWAAMPSG